MCNETDLVGWLDTHGFALTGGAYLSPNRLVRVIPGPPVTTVVRYSEVRPYEDWRTEFGPNAPLRSIAQAISAGTRQCPHCGTDQPVWAMEPMNPAGNAACRDIDACSSRALAVRC